MRCEEQELTADPPGSSRAQISTTHPSLEAQGSSSGGTALPQALPAPACAGGCGAEQAQGLWPILHSWGKWNQADREERFFSLKIRV